jgi:hypothetical protein
VTVPLNDFANRIARVVLPTYLPAARVQPNRRNGVKQSAKLMQMFMALYLECTIP